MSEPLRVLFVNSEIFPYLPETNISKVGRFMPQNVQERGGEIRSFMPRYGVINERRNQLHEVIRLSGMNIIVNDIDRPLVIKVSSISSARMQVYFIDNEDYFHRKYVYGDEENEYFEDNDERSIFFARGVLETVKKLRWKPTIVHCQGWISHLVPLLIKKVYIGDPLFADSKIITSLYNEGLNQNFKEDIRSKVVLSGVKNKDIEPLTPANGINLAKLAIKHSNGIIVGEENLAPELSDVVKEAGLPTLEYIDINAEDSTYMDDYFAFYDKILAK